MIISRTPLRISFTGGGSDLPAYYRKFSGAVISTSIDKYVYISVNKKFDDGIRLSYSKTEDVISRNQLEHKLVKATLEYLDINGGLEITSIADIPSKGTGLGSSSSFTVGLLNALNAFKSSYTSQSELGKKACEIEIDLCLEPIGKQDHYAAAYGGFNFIEFKPDESVVVTPIICKSETIKTIEDNIIIFYTGITRSASNILLVQSKVINSQLDKQDIQKRMVELTIDLKRELQNDNLDNFGSILHENWLLKKSLVKEISSGDIDDLYERARRAGATGGKILGAGAGGFLLFYAPLEKHDAIRKELKILKEVKIKFEPVGSQIIYYQN
jgi:D-glycero-alpha-D-manno-heptose-7-phosphate kinase